MYSINPLSGGALRVRMSGVRYHCRYSKGEWYSAQCMGIRQSKIVSTVECLLRLMPNSFHQGGVIMVAVSSILFREKNAGNFTEFALP